MGATLLEAKLEGAGDDGAMWRPARRPAAAQQASWADLKRQGFPSYMEQDINRPFVPAVQVRNSSLHCNALQSTALHRTALQCSVRASAGGGAQRMRSSQSWRRDRLARKVKSARAPGIRQ